MIIHYNDLHQFFGVRLIDDGPEAGADLMFFITGGNDYRYSCVGLEAGSLWYENWNGNPASPIIKDKCSINKEAYK